MKFLFILVLSLTLRAETMLDQWQAPLQDNESQKILIYGTFLTSGLVLFRKDTIDKFQDYGQKNGLMSDDMAHIGDLAGQVIPNALYIASQLIFHSDEQKIEAYRRVNIMAQATFYAGITTMILKRTFNQRRPDSDNKHSFPSGHTTTAFAFASVVAMEHDWYYGLSAYSLAGIVGLSRIHDNAHYIHDVVMGATIGTAFGVALSKLSHKKKNTSYALSPLEGGFMLKKQMAF
jgi:membrane-associated phospholipid phosphatase